MKINADGVKRRDAFSVPPEHLTLVTDIDHPLYDPRVHDPLPEAFVENIAQEGIHTPVIIRKVGKGADEKLEVVDGRQRVRAALQINQRRRGIRRDPIEVPCVVKTDVEEALFAASISCNEARRNDGLLEKAAKAQRLRDNGLSLKNIAVKFCVQPQTVEFWLELLSLAKEVRDEIKAGTITATAAREFVGLNREGQIELLGRVLAEAEPAPSGGRKKISGNRIRALSGDRRGPAKRPLTEIKARADNLAENLKLMQGDAERTFNQHALAVLNWVLSRGDWPSAKEN